MLSLHEWETYYVIVGSSAAALTGLQFVVIALGAQSRASLGSEDTVDAFATPTVVHLSAVLTLAAIMTVPGQSAATLSLCLSVAGAVGVLYAVMIAIRARRQTLYSPVLEDWLWHVGFPIVAYATLLITGIAARSHTAGALYVVAAAALFLLFIGIHNAWDSAVYMATRKNDGE